jgi:hypothetical protein
MKAALAAIILAIGAVSARAEPREVRVDVEGHGVPAAVVDEMRASAPRLEQRVVDVLELGEVEPIHVDLLPAIESAVKLEPPWSLPDWAAGAAEPSERRIVVAVTAKGERQDRERILLHELAHIGVRDAANGMRVPRWLDEGAARFVAQESDDPAVLARARVADRLLPLASLADGFPADGAEANVAYAESSRAVSILGPKLPAVLRAIGQGKSVDDALGDVVGRRAWQLDNDIAASIPLGRAWAILGLNSELAYALAALVTAWAGLRARRQIRRRMRAMDDLPSRWWSLDATAVGLRRWTVQS